MKNYGLLEKAIELGAYLLGQQRLPMIPYVEDGNWEDFLPRYENQTTKHGQETSGCTVWGSQNQIETFEKCVFDSEPNYSERFTYLLTGIEPSKGTDPQNTYECIRKNGLIVEALLPMTNSLEDYLDKSDITGSLLARGINWTQRYDFKHEWVWASATERPLDYMDVLKDMLKTSPVGVSVSAWNEENGVFVSNKGSVNNHFCLLYKFDEEGYPWIFDSYDHSKKKLSKDHNIRRAKRIWMNKKTKQGLRNHRNLLQEIIHRLTMKPYLIDVCESYIGKDASPNDLAPDELGCAETVTTLLKKVYPETPILTYTPTFHDYLKNPKNGWYGVEEPMEEDVVISPTGLGKGTGHTGIVMNGGTIASNDSGIVRKENKGKFLKNYSVDTWKKSFSKRGFPTLFYRKKK